MKNIKYVLQLKFWNLFKIPISYKMQSAVTSQTSQRFHFLEKHF